MMNSKIQKAEDGKNAGSAKKSVQTAVFENPEFGTVRIVTDEKGEPWFCAKDLCDVLGYKRATDAVRQHVGLAVRRNTALLELSRIVLAFLKERCRTC